MKTFKTIDCYIQGGLFLVALFTLTIFRIDAQGYTFFMLYFIVGGWQVFSMIVHWGYAKEHKIVLRKVYHVALAVTLGIGLISLLSDFVLEYFFGLLFVSPVLAIVYFICCYIETSRLEKAKKVQAVSEG